MLFWFLLSAGTLVRLVEAIRRPLQVDEAFTLNIAGLPVGAASDAMAADVHPPLLVLLLHPLEAAHAPDLIPRLLMVGCGAVSLALLFAIVKRWAGGSAALVALGCAAFMPTLTYYDTWVRMFAPFSAVEIAAWYALTVLTTDQRLAIWKRRGFWILWTACTIAASYLLYLGWICAAAQLLWVVAARRDALVRALVGFGAAFMVWLPQLATFARQLPNGGNTWPWALAHPAQAILLIAGSATVVPYVAGEAPLWVFGVVWLCVLAAIVGAMLIAPKSMLPWLAMPALLTVAVSLATHRSLYLDRYFLLLAYAVAACVGLVLCSAAARFGRAWTIVAAAVILGLCADDALLSFNPFFYTADWPSVERYLAAHALPADAIIAEQGTAFSTLARDGAVGSHPFIGVTHASDVPVAERGASAYPRIWLILFQTSAIDPGAQLLGALARDYNVAAAARFARASPSETVTIGLLVRRERGSRRGFLAPRETIGTAVWRKPTKKKK